MKLVVLAGGRGTRLSEETSVKPKPMVEIGGQPMLSHILQLYRAHVDEAIICAGYRSDVIRSFFEAGESTRANAVTMHGHGADVAARGPKVTVVDTGEDTMTGGRLLRVRELLGGDRFHLTYGDGLSDVNIGELTKFHMAERAMTTLTAVPTPPRFGAVTLSSRSNRIQRFGDPPEEHRGWINGGFFVVEPGALDCIEGDDTTWESVLERLAGKGELAAYRHRGFWHAMDTLHDKHRLESLWASGDAPWKSP